MHYPVLLKRNQKASWKSSTNTNHKTLPDNLYLRWLVSRGWPLISSSFPAHLSPNLWVTSSSFFHGPLSHRQDRISIPRCGKSRATRPFYLPAAASPSGDLRSTTVKTVRRFPGHSSLSLVKTPNQCPTHSPTIDSFSLQSPLQGIFFVFRTAELERARGESSLSRHGSSRFWDERKSKKSLFFFVNAFMLLYDFWSCDDRRVAMWYRKVIIAIPILW